MMSGWEKAFKMRQVNYFKEILAFPRKNIAKSRWARLWRKVSDMSKDYKKNRRDLLGASRLRFHGSRLAGKGSPSAP
jgi:hypothetical protein